VAWQHVEALLLRFGAALLPGPTTGGGWVAFRSCFRGEPARVTDGSASAPPPAGPTAVI